MPALKSPHKMVSLFGMILSISLINECNYSVSPEVKGNSSDIDGIVCGILYMPDGKEPARGASVTMRFRNYLKNVPNLSKRKADEPVSVLSTTTDHFGFYRFAPVQEGIYCIDGQDSNNNLLFIDSIVIETNSSRLFISDTFKAPAVLQGKIPLYDTTMALYIGVFGLDILTEVKPDGTCSIGNLPEGKLRLQFTYVINGFISYDTIEVITTANCTITVDTLFSPPVIITQSDTLTPIAVGGSVTLSVAANGKPHPLYKWYKDSVFLDSNYTGLYTIPKIIKADSGVYWCSVVNKMGVANSLPIRLLVLDILQRFTLILTDSGNGSVNPKGTIAVDSGVPVLITALADPGYEFREWRVISGQAIIRDSTAITTSVRLFNNAQISGIFKVITFTKSLGGPNIDCGNSVWQTGDGGYIITGETWNGDSDCDVYLIKTDATGTEMWTKKFGKSGNEAGSSVQQTSDGGYSISGMYRSNQNGFSDVYLIKTDPMGNELWTKTYGDTTDDEVAYSFQQTSDNGYIITGTKDFGAVYLVKTDAAGNTSWAKTFSDSVITMGKSVQQTSDGGYIIGTYDGNRGSVIKLIKTDTAGNETWVKEFDGSFVNSVRQTNDGGYILIGNTGIHITPNQLKLYKTDGSGNQLWSKTYGNEACKLNRCSGQQTKDGGYIITGQAIVVGNGQNPVLYLLKTDANGNEMWAKTFNESDYDFGSSVQQTNDGGYIITGQTNFNVYLVKTDENGDVR